MENNETLEKKIPINTQAQKMTDGITTETEKTIFDFLMTNDNICAIPESKQSLYTGHEEDYFPDENDK